MHSCRRSRLLTLRPLRSSSLWMAMADTHLLSPPSGAAVTDTSAMRSVAPWSVWKARRDALMLLRLPFLSARFCAVPAPSQWQCSGTRQAHNCRHRYVASIQAHSKWVCGKHTFMLIVVSQQPITATQYCVASTQLFLRWPASSRTAMHWAVE